MNVDLCVSCRDKPTVEILNEVTELIRKHSNSSGKFTIITFSRSFPVSDEMVLSESDGINIESIPSQAAICITKSINGYLTLSKLSVIIRCKDDDAINDNCRDSLLRRVVGVAWGALLG